jgi:hypothetical protein
MLVGVIAVIGFAIAQTPTQHHPPSEISPQGPGSTLNADLLDNMDTGTTANKIAYYASDGKVENCEKLDGLDSSSFLTTASDYGRSGVATNLYEGPTKLSNKYLGISAKAADSDKLDGLDSSAFQRDLSPNDCGSDKAIRAVTNDGVVTCIDVGGGGITCSDCDSRFVNVAGDSMTGNLGMGSNKITNLANPTNSQDAATKSYVDASKGTLSCTYMWETATCGWVGSVYACWANAYCPTGYTVTGGGCSFADPRYTTYQASRALTTGDGWRCLSYRTNSESMMAQQVFAQCCKVE